MERNAQLDNNDFVADGYDRALKEIEAEIRSEIESKNTDQWNASGLIKRWSLQRRIEREIAERVAERTQHISLDSMF